jgi:transposase
MTEIAGLLAVTRQRVYNWVQAYVRKSDPNALQDVARPGRPRLWTQQRQTLLRSLLETSPDRLGYFGVNGTVPLLQAQSEHTIGQRLSEHTIRGEWARRHYVWKRYRYVLDPQQEQEKKRSIRRFLPHLRSETAIVIEDETDLLRFAPLRGGGALRGEPAEVLLRGFNARRVIFGAMDRRTGQRLFTIRQRQRRGDLPVLLKAWRQPYGKRPIALLLDHVRSDPWSILPLKECALRPVFGRR